ncbi:MULTISPECIES: glycosyltransferase family 4 protein [unclassified Sphingobacterium]|uniref:glycosyltransferase family 4 protein n=1 Tax=unclassified Sphingobacterium TaxID=2609468 RepID=UPI0025F3F975|nr:MULTISPECIES: glycosyltransferase family 4 protein [unclassified Sphingobacterium]
MSSSEIEILFVSHKYPPNVGGMEKQSFELINTTALYLKVHTLVYDNSEPLLKFFIQLNRRILVKIKDNPSIKIIHFNDGLIASLASFHKGYNHLKRVVTIHGLDIVFPLRYFQRKVIPRFNTFDQIVAVSQATADAAKLRGINPAKIIVIPNGVDPIQISAQVNGTKIESKPYFITLGRPVKRKGFSWLMQHVIPAIQGDFKLLMVGPFDRRPRWKEYLLDLFPSGISHLITLFLGFPTDQRLIRKLLKSYPEKIEHLGKVPFEQLKHLLTNAHAFLMPNIEVLGDMEGFGLVCLEASTAGTIVVASELEGITSAVAHHCNGLLVASKDEKAWIEQLQAILDNPVHYKKLSQQFKQNTLAQYGWDIMARSYCQSFFDLCNKTTND